MQEKQEQKINIKSLAEELRQRISKKESSKPSDEDRKIQEISEHITKKEVKKEAREIKIRKTDKETLIPLEDYIKCAVHLGTKVITPHMRKYVYKRRADGLAVINTALIDEKLREAIDFIIKYEPEQIYLSCKEKQDGKLLKNLKKQQE